MTENEIADFANYWAGYFIKFELQRHVAFSDDDLTSEDEEKVLEYIDRIADAFIERQFKY